MEDTTTVLKKKYDKIVSGYIGASELLNAIELFSPMNLARLVEHLTDLFSVIDTRLAYIEKRLDVAGIKPLPDGIPDDDVERYLAMPVVDFLHFSRSPFEDLKRLAAMRGETALKRLDTGPQDGTA